MDKLLTIIIPTYNMEKYLKKCLDSLLVAKNFDLLEVLVVNDGSKDSSSVIAHEYREMLKNFFGISLGLHYLCTRGRETGENE